MCCCGKPTINGEHLAYSWDGKTFITRQVDAPELADGDELLFDEPGRCGGIDCHAYHFRLVKNLGKLYLLVRHSASDERLDIGRVKQCLGIWQAVSPSDRFWLLQSIHSAARKCSDKARESESAKWRIAAAEKRIVTRKLRGQNLVNVSIKD